MWRGLLANEGAEGFEVTTDASAGHGFNGSLCEVEHEVIEFKLDFTDHAGMTVRFVVEAEGGPVGDAAGVVFEFDERIGLEPDYGYASTIDLSASDNGFAFVCEAWPELGCGLDFYHPGIPERIAWLIAQSPIDGRSIAREDDGDGRNVGHDVASSPRCNDYERLRRVGRSPL